MNTDRTDRTDRVGHVALLRAARERYPDAEGTLFAWGRRSDDRPGCHVGFLLDNREKRVVADGDTERECLAQLLAR